MAKTLLSSILLAALTLAAQAQDETTAPQVNDDLTVTFSLQVSGAAKVEVDGSWGKSKMTPEADSTVWTLTTEALTSDMHTYRFIVDGSYRTDPLNDRTVRDIDDTLSYFFIDGTPGSLLQEQDVEHGTVEQRWYPSSFRSDMEQRRLSVYLPPTYADSTDSLPVLYLLHGTGGDELAWLEMGRLACIMDNMLAEGQCQPMIVVMPNGQADQDAAPGCSPYRENTASHANVSSWLGRTEAAFANEVVAFIDSTYHTLPDKQHRAIAGLSMGGLHTIAISANNPDMFDYVGLFSPQTMNALTDKNIKAIQGVSNTVDGVLSKIPFVNTDNLREQFGQKTQHLSDIDVYKNLERKLIVQAVKEPKLYYIAIGKKDPLKRFVSKFTSKLDDCGATYQYQESEGGHSWNNWRNYLIDFLPQIFTSAE